MKYFEVHVFFDRKNGYSIATQVEDVENVLSDGEFLNEDKIIEHCVKENLFTDASDAKQVDYVGTISVGEYLLLKS